MIAEQSQLRCFRFGTSEAKLFFHFAVRHLIRPIANAGSIVEHQTFRTVKLTGFSGHTLRELLTLSAHRVLTSTVGGRLRWLKSRTIRTVHVERQLTIAAAWMSVLIEHETVFTERRFDR
jgi:hypothetical protein